MRFAPFLVLLCLLAPLGWGAPSSVQNDGATGGDAGNTPSTAAPLSNRTDMSGPTGNPYAYNGSEGVYLGEMYRVSDESDWFSFVMPVEGNVIVNFTAQTPILCSSPTGAPDTTFVAEISNGNSTIVGAPVVVDACYSPATLAVHLVPWSGHNSDPEHYAGERFRLGFVLAHPSNAIGDATGITPPTTTVIHVQYAFSFACGGVCFQGGRMHYP